MQVRVKVAPGAKKESFTENDKGVFLASVREPRERNLANKAVILLLARHFGVPPGKVRLLSGQRSSGKVFKVGA